MTSIPIGGLLTKVADQYRICNKYEDCGRIGIRSTNLINDSISTTEINGQFIVEFSRAEGLWIEGLVENGAGKRRKAYTLRVSNSEVTASKYLFRKEIRSEGSIDNIIKSGMLIDFGLIKFICPLLMPDRVSHPSVIYNTWKHRRPLIEDGEFLQLSCSETKGKAASIEIRKRDSSILSYSETRGRGSYPYLAAMGFMDRESDSVSEEIHIQMESHMSFDPHFS